MALASRPGSPVTVEVSAGSLLSVTPTPLLFLPERWSSPQPLTLRASAGPLTQSASMAMTLIARSADAMFDGVVAEPVRVDVVVPTQDAAPRASDCSGCHATDVSGAAMGLLVFLHRRRRRS